METLNYKVLEGTGYNGYIPVSYTHLVRTEFFELFISTVLLAKGIPGGRSAQTKKMCIRDRSGTMETKNTSR